MSGLWIQPLLVILAMASVLIFIAGLIFMRPRTLRGWILLFAAALAPPLLPFLLFSTLWLYGQLQPSDSQRYAQLFKFPTTMSEEQMIFNDSGSGAGRKVFMRARPDPNQRRQVMNLSILEPSTMRYEDVEALAEPGLGWWVGLEECRNPQIREARSALGWDRIVVMQCNWPPTNAERWDDLTLHVVAIGEQAFSLGSPKLNE